LRRLLFGLFAAISSVWPATIATAAATPTAESFDAELLKPNLVDIGGGRRLNIVCVGEGLPVVVFQQGGEGSFLNWKKVQKPITSMTRTCFYDRAGFGYSDPPSGAVTGLSETDDLHTLLRKANIPLPVVFVGHSVGGFYATLYTDRFRDDVAGMVLVDPGFANQYNPRTDAMLKLDVENNRRGDDNELACAALARQGLMSLENTHGCIGFAPADTPAELAYLTYMVSHPYWYEAEVSQSRNFFFGDHGPSEDSQEELAARRSFGDLPLIVLTADRFSANPWEDAAAVRARQDDWNAGHAELAARSKRGTSIMVSNSAHFIQLDQPDAVIAAVKKVVAEVRARQNASPVR
jgi:pimeloyl-ACP methyl ester carboxylesterase